LDEDKAIVTDISGTTRDVIEAELNLDGILLNLMDTAGIRDARDEVERIGIKRTTAAIEKADLVLLVLDQSDELTDNDRRLLTLTADKSRILVGNKTDLGTNITLADEHIINISAKEKAGLHELAAEVRRMFIDEDIIESGDPILANTRHIAMIERTQTALEDAMKSCEEGFPVDMTEIDLRNAWQHLSDILGETTDDALLDSIFSRFCLGK
jgi:tRNA modification GTPase